MFASKTDVLNIKQKTDEKIVKTVHWGEEGVFVFDKFAYLIFTWKKIIQNNCTYYAQKINNETSFVI